MTARTTTGRLPWPTRDELDEDASAVYDAIVASRGGSGAGGSGPVGADGRLLGPFNAMLFNPVVGDALQALGAAIRYRSSLADRVRELAILTVAAHRHSAFEWHAHEPLAIAAGLDRAKLEHVRDADGNGLEGADALVHRCVRTLLTDRDLGDDDVTGLQELLGVTGVVELVTLVGYYDLLALSMRTFRVELPETAGTDRGVPPVR